MTEREIYILRYLENEGGAAGRDVWRTGRFNHVSQPTVAKYMRNLKDAGYVKQINEQTWRNGQAKTYGITVKGVKLLEKRSDEIDPVIL